MKLVYLFAYIDNSISSTESDVNTCISKAEAVINR